MNRPSSAPLPLRAAVLALAAAATAGCSWFGSSSPSGDKVDYRTTAKLSPELEVPPDLTQLAREGRYQNRTGVVSANEIAAQQSAAAQATAAAPGAQAPAAAPAAAAGGVAMRSTTTPAAPPAPAAAGAASGAVAPAVAAPAAAAPVAGATVATAAAPGVAPTEAGDVRLAREGQTRWLVTRQTPEQVWPLAEAFWRDLGFTLPTDSPQTGVMETSWAENRALLPDDIVRRSIGSVLGSLYSTGLRDKYRTRIERGPEGTEIYIAHRGAEEVLYGDRRDLTIWQPRPSDPQLENEMLSRLMLRLGGLPEQAKAIAPASVAKTTTAAPPPELALPDKAEMEVAETFDRAWRQVGLALDRSGFTIEDRDRSAGLYFVRYVDPKQAGKEEPNFFQRLFSSNTADPGTPQRYRVAVKAAGTKTAVSIQDGKGAPDNSENARRIVARLQQDFRR